MPGALPSIRDFIGNLAAYIIPASLEIFTNDLPPMAENELDPPIAAPQTADSSSKGSCSHQGWSDAEIHTLVYYLYDHKDKMSGGGFKDVVWTGLGRLLADKHQVTRSTSSMKTKFSEVCNYLFQ